MSWGRHWGRLWGGQTESGIAFELLSARATASNSFQVTFSKQPRLYSPVTSTDASYLQNWTLTRLDRTQRLTILTVRPVSGDVTTIEFVIAERWESKLAEYRIEGSSSILSANLQENLITPAQADFFGAPETVPAVERDQGLVDLYNPQVASDERCQPGGLVIGTGGDYELEAGLSFLKKVIIRGVFSDQGEFVHLADVDWGLGLKAKTFFTDADLITEQRRIELQLAREPEIISSSARLVLYSDGRLVLTIKAKTDFGPLELTTPVAVEL